MKIKKLRLWCLLLAVLVLISACNNRHSETSQPDTTTSGGEEETTISLSDFQIVRAEKASQEIIAAVIALNKTINEQNGKSLKVRTDFEESDETDYEILIGNVSRTQLQDAITSLTAGDYLIKTVRTEKGAKLIVGGFNDSMTLIAVEEFEQLIKNNSVIDEKGNISALNSKNNFYERYKDFDLVLGEKYIVGQPDEIDDLWGHYQFPTLSYTKDGHILATWAMHNDSVYGGGLPPGKKVSEDGGKTWRDATPSDIEAYDVEMKNGKCFAGFVAQAAYAVDYLDKYQHVATGIQNTKLYFAEDVKEFNTDVTGREYNPATGQITTFPVKVNWPYMPLAVHDGNAVIPISRIMAINNGMGTIAIGDDLYHCTYSRGFDSKTGTVTDYSGYFSVYIFKSTDSGRTWNYLSQISVTKENYNTHHNFEGFCEPMMEQMPDGSIVMLMRTGGNNVPSYLARSTDDCKSWSEPTQFDKVGVLPQIMTLECGVTIASYGRTGLFVRATSDLSGLVWEEPIQINLGQGAEYRSCYYTRLLPLDATTALFIYSDFYYPYQNGTGTRKTILVTTITIVPKSD